MPARLFGTSHTSVDGRSVSSVSETLVIFGQSNARGSNTGIWTVRALEGLYYPNDTGQDEWLTSGQHSSAVGMLVGTHDPSVNRLVIEVGGPGQDIDAMNDTYAPEARARCTLLNTTPRVVLFLQGEADCQDETKANEFLGKLRTLISTWRVSVPDLAFLFCPLITTASGYTFLSTINNAFDTIVGDTLNCSIIDTSDLSLSDGLHYTSLSQDEIGRRASLWMVNNNYWPRRSVA